MSDGYSVNALYNKYFRKETITRCIEHGLDPELYNKYFRKETITSECISGHLTLLYNKYFRKETITITVLIVLPK